MRLGLLAFLCVAVACSVSAQTVEPEARSESRPVAGDAVAFPYFGQITGSKVRIRGGPGDFHSEVVRLDADAIVKVVGRRGEWLEVQVPGGLPLWVAMGADGKEYVRRHESGAHVVVVNDLQIRGTPNTNEPPLGELRAGDQILVLSTNADWAQILMPTGHAGYVFHNLVKVLPDQGVGETAFAARDEAARAEWVAHGAVSAAAEKDRIAVKGRQERLAAALELYETERRKDLLDRDAAAVRTSLEGIIGTQDAQSPEAIRATAALDAVKGWEQDAKARKDARDAIAEAERKTKAAQITYEKDLEELRKRKEAEASQRERGKIPYLTTGWVRLAPPLVHLVDKKTPRYAIHRGSYREYYLVSDRYDLSQYANKLVGILEWDPPESVPGSEIRVVRVRKIEILPGNK